MKNKLIKKIQDKLPNGSKKELSLELPTDKPNTLITIDSVSKTDIMCREYVNDNFVCFEFISLKELSEELLNDILTQIN